MLDLTKTLDKESAIRIMNERGYNETGVKMKKGEERIIMFSKRSKKTEENEIILHAEVDIIAQQIQLSCVELSMLCFLSTSFFNFFHKEFNKFEEVVYFYSMRCKGIEIKDALNIILDRKSTEEKPAIKQKESIKERNKEFAKRVVQAAKEKGIDKDTALRFYKYWTEQNPGGKKVRWEMEKLFDIKRRLTTWLEHDKKWNKTFKTEKVKKQNEEKEEKIIKKSELF